MGGGAENVQELEDTGKLMRITVRKMCVGCHQQRSPDDTVCGKCGIIFTELLPGTLEIDECLARTIWDYDVLSDCEDFDVEANHWNTKEIFMNFEGLLVHAADVFRAAHSSITRFHVYAPFFGLCAMFAFSFFLPGPVGRQFGIVSLKLVG